MRQAGHWQLYPLMKQHDPYYVLQHPTVITNQIGHTSIQSIWVSENWLNGYDQLDYINHWALKCELMKSADYL